MKSNKSQFHSSLNCIATKGMSNMSATTAAQAAILQGLALRPTPFSNFPGVFLPSCMREVFA